jgi:hypothetical protein
MIRAGLRLELRMAGSCRGVEQAVVAIMASTSEEDPGPAKLRTLGTIPRTA